MTNKPKKLTTKGATTIYMWANCLPPEKVQEDFSYTFSWLVGIHFRQTLLQGSIAYRSKYAPQTSNQIPPKVSPKSPQDLWKNDELVCSTIVWVCFMLGFCWLPQNRTVTVQWRIGLLCVAYGDKEKGNCLFGMRRKCYECIRWYVYII